MNLIRKILFSSFLLFLTPTNSSVPEFDHSIRLIPSRITPISRREISIPIPELISLYTDCDIKDYSGKKPFQRKTMSDIVNGVSKRRKMEGIWTKYFNEQVPLEQFSLHYIDSNDGFQFPVKGNISFDNSFDYKRIRGSRWAERHGAIDVFAPIGSEIRSPINGLIVASAKNWHGSWSRKKGFQYDSGGLGELSGNGTIIFSPSDTSYYFLIHMRDVYAKTGDLVFRGDPLGTVGVTGNAIYPSVQKHLHIAHKKTGRACGIEGVLVSQNPYLELRSSQNFK